MKTYSHFYNKYLYAETNHYLDFQRYRFIRYNFAYQEFFLSFHKPKFIKKAPYFKV